MGSRRLSLKNPLDSDAHRWRIGFIAEQTVPEEVDRLAEHHEFLAKEQFADIIEAIGNFDAHKELPAKQYLNRFFSGIASAFLVYVDRKVAAQFARRHADRLRGGKCSGKDNAGHHVAPR